MLSYHLHCPHAHAVVQHRNLVQSRYVLIDILRMARAELRSIHADLNSCHLSMQRCRSGTAKQCAAHPSSGTFACSCTEFEYTGDTSLTPGVILCHACFAVKSK